VTDDTLQLIRSGTNGVSGASRAAAPRALCLCILLALYPLLLSACAPANHTRPAAQQALARGVYPDTLALTADNFADTDGNRFRDTTGVIVYLFAQNRPIPVAAPGSFTFVLETSAGERLAEWRFDHQQTAAAGREFGPGPGYFFELSLFAADAGSRTDRLDHAEGELLVTFTPLPTDDREDAPRPIRRRGTPLQIGPVRR
jgi:hypothetical protein